MFIEAVIKGIETAGIATFGKGLFGSFYPSTAPDTCILVRSSGGPPPSLYLPVREYAVQFLTRASNYPAAEELAWKVFELFHGAVDISDIYRAAWKPKHNYSLEDPVGNSYYVLKSEAMQMPSDIGPDEAGRAETSFNILFKVRLGSTTI